MGNILCCRRKKTKRKIVLLLVGLDNAGKTVAAKGLAGEPLDTTVPTVGFSVFNLKYHSYKVRVYDLGGGPNIRGIWSKYFVDVHGVIFVVDSSDYLRLEEAKTVLTDLVTHNKISGKPILLLANKQDNENALDEIDLIDQLNIEKLVNDQKCPTLIETCTANEKDGNSKAVVDPGIKKGYDWLLEFIIKNYNGLNERVEKDVSEQDKIEKELMKEKIERIRSLAREELKKKEEDEIESYSNYERKMEENRNSNGNIFTVEPKFSENINYNSSLDEKSSESPPSSYHVKPVRVIPERPKSAVQMVKQQLKLNNVKSPKKRSFMSKHNKTTPLNLQRPQSALVQRTTSFTERRTLKSAGDHKNFKSVGCSSTDSPMGPNGDATDPFSLKFYQNNYLEQHISYSGNVAPWFHKTINGDSGISVIDVD